jgi:hypothetical protein
MHRDTHRGTGGRDRLTGANGVCVRPFPRIDRDVEVPRRIGDSGEQREVGGVNELGRIGLFEQGIRIVPSPRGGRDTRSLTASNTRHPPGFSTRRSSP